MKLDTNNIDLNAGLIKNESGLFVDPSVALKTKQDSVVDKYNERYVSAINAPTPNIKVAYSYILTTAIPPKMKGTTAAGLFLNELDVDVRMLKKLEVMTENVSDEQVVLLVGHHITDEIVSLGDSVKIDFRRYRTLNDDHTRGVIETSYEIPMYEIDGHEYLLLDARDIIYSIPKLNTTDEVTKE